MTFLIIIFPIVSVLIRLTPDPTVVFSNNMLSIVAFLIAENNQIGLVSPSLLFFIVNPEIFTSASGFGYTLIRLANELVALEVTLITLMFYISRLFIFSNLQKTYLS